MSSPQCFFKTWFHSREEDIENIEIYRPLGFNFPLSRGREGFEIKPDGEFVLLPIGSDDRNIKIAGKWRMENNKMRVSTADLSYPDFALEILECNENCIKVRHYKFTESKIE